MKRCRACLMLPMLIAVLAVSVWTLTPAWAGPGHDHPKTEGVKQACSDCQCDDKAAKASEDAQAPAVATLGELAPDFTLPRVGADTEHSLSDFRGKPVVLIWQSMHCPWDYMRSEAGYARMLFPMAEEYGEKVQFLSVNSNKNETPEALAEYIEKHNMPFPLLKDEGNVVADVYEARTTPHVYIINSEGTLVYRGGIEEVPTSPEKAGQMDEQYLRPVIDALLAGEELPFEDTKSKGCSIKRVKK